MGRQSTITANPAIRAAVDGAIARGCTIDAIKEMLDAMGAEISRSAIGRHASKYADIAARQRDIRAAADAFASEFGDAEDNQSRLMIQMVTTLITENVLGADEMSAMDLNFLASAVKNSIGAAKIDDDRRLKLRKEAIEEASRVVATEGKKAGADAGALAQIQRALGQIK